MDISQHTMLPADSKKRLNVGCGRNIISGWLNLDNSDLPGVDIRFDLERCRSEKIPLADNSVDEFLLSHVIEHIKDAMSLMQELYRIAKPNAACTIKVPYGSSDDAWEDPTHVRPYFVKSCEYFCQPVYWRADYGYRGDWQVQTTHLFLKKEKCKNMTAPQLIQLIEGSRNIVKEMIVTLVAVKPAREPRRELLNAPKVELILA